MNSHRQTEPSAGISLGDIYFILFRHKWKIIILSLAGFAAAAGVYFFKPPPYQSSAELMIKYVPEVTQQTLSGDNQQVIIPGSGGDSIINAEIHILTSLDLAEEAVTNIGASNIMSQSKGTPNPILAAATIQNNLEAEPAGQGSSVIVVTFQSPNPQIVQPVLQEIINDYFQKHYEIHSAGGQIDDALTGEQTHLGVQLNATEQQLADLKNKANIISVDSSRNDLASQISKVRNDIWNAEAELSGYEASAQLGNGGQPLKMATNSPTVVPPDQADAYNSLCATLETLLKQEQTYMVEGFTKSNILVLQLDGQIASTEKAKADYELKYPQIADTAAATPGSASTVAAPARDAHTEIGIGHIALLHAMIKAWNAQLNLLETQATNLNNLSPAIAQLEQTKAIQEANYQNLSVSLERSHIDQALDPGKTPNIKWVQMPSPPFQDWKKTHKEIMMTALGGIFLGLACAFLMELYLDRSIKRPSEVGTKLKLSLFLSVPDMSRNGHARVTTTPPKRQLQWGNAGNGDVSLPTMAWNWFRENKIQRCNSEALRDRLIAYFEVKGLTHKPKLVAVTSAEHGAGVSTMAAGLAAAFSTTGDGNVLLVDMNLEHGSAQQFYKGKPVCGLDTALQNETKNDAMVQENLYVVSGTSKNDNLPSVLTRRFFAGLVPKLKASDFDYIVFDLPPVSQTSVTPRVARFMDMVLLVIESEKTDRDLIRRANEQLVEYGGSVGAVLNKTHQHVPGRIHRESLGDK